MIFTKKPKTKSRLAANAAVINTILLLIVLVLMTAVSVAIISSINKENARSVIRVYSMEAADSFYSYISGNLTLVQKAAQSKAVRDWFADENNEEKKILAFEEMMEHAAILEDAHFYFGIADSLNEYKVETGMVFSGLFPLDRLDQLKSDDEWFFKAINSENDYELRIDNEKSSGIWRLWINYKVISPLPGSPDKNIAGVFASGLRIPHIFEDIFDGYENEKRIRGYIIDGSGIIQTDSIHYSIYSDETKNHIREESIDPAFFTALSHYENRKDGFFSSLSQTELVRLTKGNYEYAAIKPISNTDWSVVVFYNGNTLSGIAHLLPLLGVMLAALLVYVAGRNALINRHIFTPFNNLIESVAEGKVTEKIFYGKDRNDEIGDLARIVHDTTLQRQRQEQLLNAVNTTAKLLLTPAEERFDETLLEGMKLIGRCVDVDRINIWRNETINGTLYYTNQFQWLSSDENRMGKPAIAMRPYNENPEWEKRFIRNECINGPVSLRTAQEKSILGPQGIKSILLIPLYLHSEFYGFFSFDDCREERSFTDDEVSILRSAGLMIVSALNRSIQATKLRQAHDQAQGLLDTTPIACNLFHRNAKLFACNEEAVKLFAMNDKQDYINRFLEISPEYQPDGSLSAKQVNILVNRAFDEGRCSYEWMHTLLDGTPIPCEVTLVRIKIGEEFVVAGYARDLREYKQMILEIEKQDNLLKEALKEAQKANSAKSNFLANMSHEMRTPLNAVLGLSELVLEAGSLSKEAEIYLEKIYNAGATLLSTVNDILDISKIEAGKMELIPVEYDMPSLLNDAVTQSIMRIGEKPIQFNLDIDEELPTRLCGDDLRIKQVMNNLLSNAFKYTERGTVDMSVRCEQEKSKQPGEADSVLMTIRVSDTGKGIRHEDVKNLFSDYAQIDAASNRKIEGTGLGLSITKRIAEMMNGSISVESEFGKGSVFTVKLRQQFVTADSIGAEVVKNLKTLKYSENKRNMNLRLARIRLPYAKVLVVDDVATNLDVARGMMKPYLMQIDCVKSGPEAIDALRNEKVKYNAVFMDHMMPGMDGIEAVRIIRDEIGTEYAKTVPIIALTANAIAGNEEMFLKKGFQAFISKPIEINRLDAIIRQWIRDKSLEEEIQINNSGQDETAEQKSQGHSTLQIDGIDTEKGITRFGGDEGSYIEVLNSYMKNTPYLLENMKAVVKEKLADYAVTAHGLKGSSRSISAEAAGNMAEALEKAAKAGDYGFVMANNSACIETVEKLTGSIETALSKIASSRQKKDKPDTAALERLLHACIEYDMDEAEDVMAEIQSCDYDSDDGLVDWLAENIETVNFTEIKNRLSALLGVI